jgi:hypothetical protein
MIEKEWLLEDVDDKKSLIKTMSEVDFIEMYSWEILSPGEALTLNTEIGAVEFYMPDPDEPPLPPDKGVKQVIVTQVYWDGWKRKQAVISAQGGNGTNSL